MAGMGFRALGSGWLMPGWWVVSMRLLDLHLLLLLLLFFWHLGVLCMCWGGLGLFFSRVREWNIHKI